MLAALSLAPAPLCGVQDADVLELDVVMSTGVAAALQMANKKGFVDNEKDKDKKKRDGSSKTIIEGLGVRDWYRN